QERQHILSLLHCFCPPARRLLSVSIFMFSAAETVLILFTEAVHGSLGMFRENLLDLFQFAKALKDTGHLVAGILKCPLPGTFFIAGHIIIGMVAGYDH